MDKLKGGPERREEGRADSAAADSRFLAGMVTVARLSLIAEVVSFAVFAVLVLSMPWRQVPGLGIIDYAVPAFGFTAVITGMLAALFLRRVRWLCVSLAAVILVLAYAAFVFKCCVTW